MIKDSGDRHDFGTGSRRDKREGKGRYDLLPFLALFCLARHFEDGDVKYGDPEKRTVPHTANWRKGQPLSVYLESFIRHACKFGAGERDEPHLSAALWNGLCLLETKALIKQRKLPVELDDLEDFDEYLND